MSEDRVAYLNGLRAHYERNWGHDGTVVPFAGGPQHELPAEFSVLEFAPSQNRNMWTYATCGMSTYGDDVPMELHICTLNRNREVVELLFATAHFHHTGSRLGVGHSVFFGKPWIGGSKCEYGLISLPYLDGPALENWTSPAGNVAKCYWLVPITASEVEYKRVHGLEDLERKFEELNLNYADPARDSVV